MSPCKACTLVWNANGLEKLESGTLMLMFARLGEFLGVVGFSNVVDGGAEFDELGMKVCFREFGRDAVDECTSCIVDEYEMSKKTRMRGE